MKIGFWNIARRNEAFMADLVAEWAIERDLDVGILLECRIPGFILQQSLNRLQASTYFASPSPVPVFNDLFCVFTKLKAHFSSPFRESGRLQARDMIVPLYGNFSLVLVHFPSKLHWQDSDQNAYSSEVRYFVEQLEAQLGHDRTVLVGDFNMHPFQAGMVQATGLHATMDRRTAESERRVVQGKSYPFFYNPMWSFFGEKGKGEVNGTYFYPPSGQPLAYFWHVFDQVILRPSMLPVFDEDSLQIITRIGSTNLLTDKGVVHKNISDHLPVVFNLNLKS